MKKKTKHKLKNQVIELDDVVKSFNTIDVLEVAELRGVEYKVPRPISDIAVKMFAQMRRGKGGASMHLANADILLEVRRMMLDDLDQLGLPFGKRTICVDKNLELTFFQIPSR